MSDKIPAFVLNLPADVDRRERVTKQFECLEKFQLRIISGCNGSTLADTATFALTRDHNWKSKKGTIGCFLSHVAAWEVIASETKPICIVLEDDADVAALCKLEHLAIPDDAEIIFLNDRLSPKQYGEPIRALPISTALQELDRSRSGPGGDGYILTPTAARKLLSDCENNLFYGHVDGRLLRYASTAEDLDTLSADSWIRTVVERHHHSSLKPKLGLLRSYVTSVPLVWHRGGTSSREREDAASVSAGIDLKDQPITVASPIKDGSTQIKIAKPDSKIPIRYWFRIKNIGDSINPYVISHASGMDPVYENDETKEHLLGIGSIMFMANRHSHVWGSGILEPNHAVPNLDTKKIHALRGRLTQDRLSEVLGKKLDVPLGDPGILIPEIPQVRRLLTASSNSNRAVLIPHYAMESHPAFLTLARELDANILSARTDSLEFIRAIAEAELVLSQSLHGLIFATAFKKPVVWISQSEDPSWTYKFFDWFSTTSTPAPRPALLGRSGQEMMRHSFLSESLIDIASLKEALPKISTSQTPETSFEATREAAPLSIRVASDSFEDIEGNYDQVIYCKPGDIDELRRQLNSIAGRYAEPIPAFIVFDASSFDQISAARSYLMDLLTDVPNVHYFVVQDDSWTGDEASSIDHSGRLRSVRPGTDWPKMLFIRHLRHFSFAAPSAAVQLNL